MIGYTKGNAKVGKLTLEKIKAVVKDLGTGHVDQTLDSNESKRDTILLTGTADAGFNLIFRPDVQKLYTVENKTGRTATLKNPSGATVSLPNNTTKTVLNDGTDIVVVSAGSTGPTGPVFSPNIATYEVTSGFAPNEVFNILTGLGLGSGVATVVNPYGDGSALTTLGAIQTDFDGTNNTVVLKNGIEMRKNGDVIYDSSTTFHFVSALIPTDYIVIKET